MFEKIPHELREFHSWVVWKYEDTDSSKPTKILYNPITHRRASSTDMHTWSSYEKAISVINSTQLYDGIGFVLSEADPYCFIDLDEPKNPNGTPVSQTEYDIRMKRQHTVFEEFNSYAELSPSGKGLHIIIKGDIPSGRKRSSIEIYSKARFMTMTGNVYRDSPIREYNESINILWKEIGKGVEASIFYAGLEYIKEPDEAILETACNANNGQKFGDLYYLGDWQKYNYPSQSEADFALVDIIAYYTQNKAQIKRIFLASKLAEREKSRADYRISYMLNRCFDRMLPPIDLDGLRDQLNAAIEKVKASKEKAKENVTPTFELIENYQKLPEPFELNENTTFAIPPGLLGEIAKYIYAQSPLPVPEISVAAAIGLLSGICGKAYNISATGLNQYIMLLSLTGCHAAGTEILMYDGSTKLVENVIVGDLLMGPDSKPRKVLNLARGRERMVRITPVKGPSFVVNENHILSLKHTTTKKRIYVTPKQWFEQSKGFRHCYKLERIGVDFENKKIHSIDPWFLGAMLGDGHFVGTPTLTGMNEEIHNRALIAASWFNVKPMRQQVEGNKAWQIRFSKKDCQNTYIENSLTVAFKKLGLWGCGAAEKFIPEEYKTSSRQNRLAILAGLIDTDGHMTCGGYDFISKSKQLSNDVIFIARSLGFAAYYDICEKYSQNGTGGIYYRVSISGDTTELPLSLEYKKTKPRLQKKDVLVTGLEIQNIEIDDYYGFALDNDHLYLTGDFTIHHNTGKEGMASGISRLITEVKKTVPSAGEFVGPGSIASEQAIYKYLNTKSSSFVSIFGEFAITLKQITAHNAQPVQEGVRKMLLDLYNKSGQGNQLQPLIYSSAEKNTSIIESPAFSMLCESSPEIFYNTLNEAMVTGGLLPRFITIENKGERTKRNKGASLVKPSAELIQNVATLCANALNLNHMKKVQNVLIGSDAHTMLEDFDNYCDSNIIGSKEIKRQLWTRANIKVLKLAALAAVGNNFFEPVIDIHCARWAIGIVLKDVRNLTEKFELGDVGDDNNEGKQLTRAVVIIKEYVTKSIDDLKSYNVDSNLHNSRIIPYGYLQKRLAQTGAFRQDRLGATNAIKRALSTLQAQGDIQEVSKQRLIKEFSVTASCYMITNLRAFGLA